MYLCPEASSASDSCQQYGEEHYGPHFTLHQWRATESLNTKDVKHLKIAGTLKYKVSGMQVETWMQLIFPFLLLFYCYYIYCYSTAAILPPHFYSILYPDERATSNVWTCEKDLLPL